MTTNIFAHRGFSKKYPENTMIAFEKAYQAGADGIEFDIQLTYDEKLAVIHDFTLERTTNGKGYVRKKSWNELKSLSAGAWFDSAFQQEKIPLLQDVFDWANGSEFILNIELKGAPRDRQLLSEKIVEMITEFDITDQVIISSFDHKLLSLIHERSDQIETAVLLHAALVEPHQYIHAHQFNGIHYYYPMMEAEEIHTLIQQAIHVRPFTVNDPAWVRFFYKIGCHGIITDDPLTALNIRNNKTSSWND